ncbi:MAG: hypothetical protein ABF254_05120 [Octadecabacter sp.]
MLKFLSIITVAMTSTSVMAQEIRFDVRDFGVLDHSIYGRGVVVIVQPNLMPNAGIHSPQITGAVDALCEAYGPRAISLVEERQGLTEPDFVGIRIVTGGPVGSYYFQAYEVLDDDSGAPLD